jgi:hypothetical protein
VRPARRGNLKKEDKMEYVSQVALEVNGKSLTDFKTVKEKKRDLWKSIKLMNKKGHYRTSSDDGVIVDYVVPSDAPEFDFESVRGGTITIDYLNGKRVTYTNVYPLEIGEQTHDEDNALIRTIDFSGTLKK